MNRRLIVAAALSLALLAGAGGCAQGAGRPSGGGTGPGVEVEAPDDWDCEKAERRKKERDDCGRLVNGRYQEWSWVEQGKTRPPAGWTPAREPAPRTTQAKPGSAPKPTGGAKKAPTGGGQTVKGGDRPAGTGSRK